MRAWPERARDETARPMDGPVEFSNHAHSPI